MKDPSWGVKDLEKSQLFSKKFKFYIIKKLLFSKFDPLYPTLEVLTFRDPTY